MNDEAYVSGKKMYFLSFKYISKATSAHTEAGGCGDGEEGAGKRTKAGV